MFNFNGWIQNRSCWICSQTPMDESLPTNENAAIKWKYVFPIDGINVAMVLGHQV